MPTGLELTALWIYVAAMTAGALLFTAWSRNPRGVPRYEYLVAITIPVWSGLAYMSLILGQGIVVVDGREVYFARYLDWLVTTPLLVVALAWTCMHRAEKKDYTIFYGLVVAQVIMILSGLFADLSVETAHRFFWYGVGCAALLVVLWAFWGPMARIAGRQGEDLARAYRIAAGYLTVQWLLYPLIFLLGPTLLEVYGKETQTVLFVIVPIFSKVGFSIVDLHLLRNLDRFPKVDVLHHRHSPGGTAKSAREHPVH